MEKNRKHKKDLVALDDFDLDLEMNLGLDFDLDLEMDLGLDDVGLDLDFGLDDLEDMPEAPDMEDIDFDTLEELIKLCH